MTLTWLLLLDGATIAGPVAAVAQSQLWLANALAVTPVPLQVICIVLIGRGLGTKAPASPCRSVLWWHRPVSVVVALFFSLGVLIILFPKGR